MKSLSNYITESNNKNGYNLITIERKLNIDFEENAKNDGDSASFTLTPIIRLTDKPYTSMDEIVKAGFAFNIYLDVSGKMSEDFGGYVIDNYKLNIRYTQKNRVFDILNSIDELTVDGMRDKIVNGIYLHLIDLTMRNRFYFNKNMKNKIEDEFKSQLK